MSATGSEPDEDSSSAEQKNQDAVPQHGEVKRVHKGHFTGGAKGVFEKYRCHGFSRMRQDRCLNFRLKGSNYCAFHGGRRRGGYNNEWQRKWNRMPGIYSKHLGPTLAEKVENFLAAPVQEQLGLYDELALARGLLAQALELQKRVEQKEKDGKEVSPQSKAAVQTAIIDAMESVTDIVDKIVKIEKTMEGAVSVTQLTFFVAQLTTIIFDVMGAKNQELAVKLNQAIKDNLRLPRDPKEAMKSIVIRADMGELPAEATMPGDR